MASLKVLEQRIRQARTQIQNNAPKLVAQSMLKETRDNFKNESYGNDDSPEPWKDRFGLSGGKLQSVEKYLNYPKLRYRGRLYRSIRPSSGMGYSAITAYAPYAEAQNEGKSLGLGTGPVRRFPDASKTVKLGGTPEARRFMGVGKRTYRNTAKVYGNILKKFI